MTDNALNMKVAFAVSFSTSEQDAEVLEPPENEVLWNECTHTSVTRIKTTRVSSFQRKVVSESFTAIGIHMI